MSDVVRIDSSISFHLSKLSNAKFSILYDISLVRDSKRKLKLITLGSERVNVLKSWMLGTKIFYSKHFLTIILIKSHNFRKKFFGTHHLKILCLPLCFTSICFCFDFTNITIFKLIDKHVLWKAKFIINCYCRIILITLTAVNRRSST